MITEAIRFLMDFALVPFALVLAIRNVRRGRGDSKGATRVAISCGVLVFVAYLFRADHVPLARGEVAMLVRFAGLALFSGARLWVYYVALEPWVRRRWPRTLISWTRLLSGRFFDPLVGRDVLIGLIGGAAIFGIMALSAVAVPWLGFDPVPPRIEFTSPMGSPRHVIYFLLANAAFFAGGAVTILILVALLRALIRNRTGAAIAAYLFLITLFLPASVAEARLFIPAALVAAAILLTLTLRVGLLSVAVASYTVSLLLDLPLTFDTSAWFFGRSLLVLLVFGALAMFGFIVSLGKKPLFGTPLLEE